MQTPCPEKMPASIEEDSTIQNAIQLTTAIALPMALKVAMELGLLEIIAKEGKIGAHLSPCDIAARVHPQVHNHAHASQMIDRILRLLSSYSVVSCSTTVADDGHVKRLYGVAPLSRYFMEGQDDQASLASLFDVINDKLMIGVWYHVKDAILEGAVPFNNEYGMSAKDYLQNDESLARIFANSMKNFNSLFINKVLDAYNGFEGLELIVDVGGGNGFILKAIISQNPTIKGINFDLPSVIEKQSIYPGIQHIAGDMFDSIPTGDAIFIKWVLRHLNDQRCLDVLKNCFKALPNGGKLMVVELVIPDIPDTSINSRSIFQFDLYLTNMINVEGKERTTGEFQALAKAAGFSGIQAMVRAYDITLLEFHKISNPNKD